MERYDNIEYSFGEAEFIPPSDSITVTDSEGFITSQQYAAEDESTDEYNDYSEEYENPEPTRKRDRNAPRETVLVFQLAVCILLAIAAFAVKSIGGELYNEVRTFYYNNINNSIIIETDNNNNLSFVSEILNNADK